MTTATAQTLVISRATVLELLATITAAGRLVDHDEDEPDREALADAVHASEARFREELLGELGDELDELDARSSEVEADMLEAAWLAEVRDSELHARFACERGRPARLRLLAQRVREVGMDDARYPTEEELLEARRGGDDAR